MLSYVTLQPSKVVTGAQVHRKEDGRKGDCMLHLLLIFMLPTKQDCIYAASLAEVASQECGDDLI